MKYCCDAALNDELERQSREIGYQSRGEIRSNRASAHFGSADGMARLRAWMVSCQISAKGKFSIDFDVSKH